jgi:hypothetical protein
MFLTVKIPSYSEYHANPINKSAELLTVKAVGTHIYH